jgi:hypothetical protein
MNSVGGTENATVSANAVLASHNHTYQNCFYCAWEQGPYQRFTKYSTVYATFSGYDWDNKIYGINDTTSSTGSGSGSYNINIMPAYVSKMYIMKMPTTKPEYKYWSIVVVKPALGTITTSVTDKIRDGSRITISVTPDIGCRVKKVKVNGKEVKAKARKPKAPKVEEVKAEEESVEKKKPRRRKPKPKTDEDQK